MLTILKESDLDIYRYFIFFSSRKHIFSTSTYFFFDLDSFFIFSGKGKTRGTK